MMQAGVVRCTHERHAQAILDILNEAIVSSTALYDYEPRSLASMRAWFDAKASRDFPVIGVEDTSGKLLAFASYGTFRAWPAYKYSVEHSVYVHAEHRGKGLGLLLMRELIACATAQDCHTLVGVIDSDNQASIAFHEQLGFRHAGTLNQAGFKFGRWLDVAFYQLLLATPVKPQDG
ncbi:GNAT family N-acetyltransferase [Uliginosibacterium sp. H3]|uniref:GNAT family N-acetyltransferase n=1 Tax=Uliginosibacterium silvisoli TaxID=3114758 RepID=A0ABU6K591_9RHOO|nr:GNAT family N-acetyltransferase [Uliginosibacterium sp. H3]